MTIGELISAHIGHHVSVTETHLDGTTTVHHGELVAIEHTRRESWITGEEKPGGRVTWVTLRSGLPVHGAPKWKNDRPMPLASTSAVVVGA
jgi:hypothetical protein